MQYDATEDQRLLQETTRRFLEERSPISEVRRLMHDAVPSTIRTGVASGISAVSWIFFLPFALGFGAVSKQSGVYTSGWMITAAAALAGAALIWVIVRPMPDAAESARTVAPEAAEASGSAEHHAVRTAA